MTPLDAGQAIGRPRADPISYSMLMKSVATSRFQRDHPRRGRNVFLMMGYGATPMRRRIRELVAEAGLLRGFDVLRADDTDYTGEVWTNAQLCLDNCSLGIAVFDRDDQTAVNLGVELGYLFAKGARCLIMRERALLRPPAMLAHRLHTPFDAFDLESTLAPPVERWLEEQGAPLRRFGGWR